MQEFNHNRNIIMKTKSIFTACCLMAAFSLNSEGKIVENGGKGPYKAEVVTAASLPGHTIYKPQDLKAAAKEEGFLPVMVWVNGSTTGASYESMLNEVASQGYVVVDAENSSASVNDVIAWVNSQSRGTGSEYSGTISGFGLALGGQPSSAVLGELLQGRSVRTVVLANSTLGAGKGIKAEDLAKYRGSVLYLVGGEKSSVYSAALKDYNAITSSNTSTALLQVDRKHNAQALGADYFGRLATRWLDWALKSDRNALGIFRDGELAMYEGSALKSKNFPPAEYEYPGAHDPVAAYCDGRYYVFTTGMNVMSSPDMKHWRYENNVFKSAPQWAQDKGFRGMPWAPDIQYINGKWYIYYSYSGFGKNKSAIGVATNKTLNPESPDFKWEDQGMIVESVPGRDEWNAIDANVMVDDDGTGWLVFGSFWRGIKMCKLNEDYTKLADPQEWFPVSRRPEGTAPETVSTDTAVSPDPRGLDFDAGNGAVEAPFLFKHDGKYYLFVSFDLCCRGAKSTYNVVVGRADKITGPYYDKNGVDMMNSGGTLVCGGNDQFAGAGHCAVVTFDGKDYIFMHGYDKDYDYDSKLLIREITWSADGWPVVNL